MLTKIDLMSPYMTNFFWLCLTIKMGLYYCMKI